MNGLRLAIFALGIALLPSEAVAQRIADISVLPSCRINPRDRVTLEVRITSPNTPSYLHSPTSVFQSESEIVVDIYPTFGGLTAPSYQIVTVELGHQRVGVQSYTVNLHPYSSWGKPTSRKGSFEVSSHGCEDLPAEPGLLFVADRVNGKVKRSATNGARLETVFAGTNSWSGPWVFGFVVDPESDELFAISGFPPVLERIDLRNGRRAMAMQLAAYPTQFEAVVADTVMRKIFWAEEVFNVAEPDERIWSASMDADEQFPITLFENRVDNLLIDKVNQKLYWSGENGSIKRCNYDGSALEHVLPGVADFLLAINDTEAKLYWSSTAESPGGVHRSNFDGSEIETFLSGIRAGHLVFDSSNSYFFWIENAGSMGQIWRASHDGKDLQNIVQGLPLYVSGLVFDDVTSKLYWVHQEGSLTAPLGSVMRCNPDGSGVEMILSGLDTPFSVVFDFARPRLRIRPTIQD